MPREQLQVHIIINADRIFMGVQSKDCDPRMTTMQGSLQAALDRLPSFIEESNRQWDVAPRNPKSTIPEPPPPVRAPATTAAKPVAKSKPAEAAQPGFF